MLQTTSNSFKQLYVSNYKLPESFYLNIFCWLQEGTQNSIFVVTLSQYFLKFGSNCRILFAGVKVPPLTGASFVSNHYISGPEHVVAIFVSPISVPTVKNSNFFVLFQSRRLMTHDIEWMVMEHPPPAPPPWILDCDGWTLGVWNFQFQIVPGSSKYYLSNFSCQIIQLIFWDQWNHYEVGLCMVFLTLILVVAIGHLTAFYVVLKTAHKYVDVTSFVSYVHLFIINFSDFCRLRISTSSC